MTWLPLFHNESMVWLVYTDAYISKSARAYLPIPPWLFFFSLVPRPSLRQVRSLAVRAMAKKRSGTRPYYIVYILPANSRERYAVAVKKDQALTSVLSLVCSLFLIRGDAIARRDGGLATRTHSYIQLCTWPTVINIRGWYYSLLKKFMR